MSADIDALAGALAGQLEGGPAPARCPGLTEAEAYAVVARVRALREARGARVLGRKMGFTNTTIWERYGVTGPMWNWVWTDTVHDLPLAEPVPLTGYLEPRIEPEIVFGLGAAPEPGAEGEALLASVEWVAHGFEIVHAPFGTWKVTGAEAAAAFGLHGTLLVGPRHPVSAAWAAALADFTVTLKRGGEPVEEGHARNVLGGPLAALAHLVRTAADHGPTPLGAGEIVSTGTITDAHPVAPGETWSTEIAGLPLAGIEARFG